MGIKFSVKRSSSDVIPDEQSQSKIFALKMDHFEELFDWLSLNDLVALSETCKRMQGYVGFYIKTNYASIKPQLLSDGIHTSKYCADIPSKLDGLKSFMKRIVLVYLERIRYGSPQKWEKLPNIIQHMKPDRFKSLKEIQLIGVIFTDEGISLIKNILGQVETVKLRFPMFLDENKEFHTSFLQFCTKVKKLCIHGERSTSIIGIDNSWLLKKYSTLEHLELTTYFRSDHMKELQIFFKQNPTLKSFATSAEIILSNRNIFINTQLKLEILSVKFHYIETFISSCELLNDLHDRGFFKQLHVYFFAFYNSSFNQEIVNQLVTFNGLSKLFIDTMKDDTDLSPLIKLKYFCCDETRAISNMNSLAEKWENLEFLQFTCATVDDIISFIRFSPKLSTIVVFRFNENDENILNVKELNDERLKLNNARKINIYVEESVYLRQKWAESQTKWNLIEIKRRSSYELNHNFDYSDV